MFWFYLMRLLPAVRTVGGALGVVRGYAARLRGDHHHIVLVECCGAGRSRRTTPARTVQDYQTALEQANEVAVNAQGLERDVSRVRQSFEYLSEQEPPAICRALRDAARLPASQPD